MDGIGSLTRQVVIRTNPNGRRQAFPLPGDTAFEAEGAPPDQNSVVGLGLKRQPFGDTVMPPSMVGGIASHDRASMFLQCPGLASSAREFPWRP